MPNHPSRADDADRERWVSQLRQESAQERDKMLSRANAQEGALWRVAGNIKALIDSGKIPKDVSVELGSILEKVEASKGEAAKTLTDYTTVDQRVNQNQDIIEELKKTFAKVARSKDPRVEAVRLGIVHALDSIEIFPALEEPSSKVAAKV